MSAPAPGSHDDNDVLISRYLDGVLDVGELAAFNRRIVNDPSFAARLYKIAHLHGSLRELGTVGTENLYGGSAAPSDGLNIPLPIALPTPGASEVSRPRGKRSVASALLVAALFLIATVGVLYVVWPKNAATLAFLKQGRNVWIVRDGNQIPVTGEMELHVGDSVRTANNGSATLVFSSANLKLELEGDAHLALPEDAGKIGQPQHIELENGVLTASQEGPAPTKPFAITTPTADVNLQNTQLTIAASPTETRLDVHAGAVQLARKSDGKTVAVTGGQYAIAGSAVEMAALPFATPAREKEEPEVAVTPRVEETKKEEPLKPWEMNITGFRVLNAETGEAIPDLTPLFYGSVIEKKKFPKGFTVEAITSPEKVGSIVFELNGRQRVCVANTPPYTVSTAKGKGFENIDLSPGMYNLRATPFTKPDGKGKPGPYMVVRFQVIRQKGLKPQGPPEIPPPKQ